jgi:excisionase family DNA binding protein
MPSLTKATPTSTPTPDSSPRLPEILTPEQAAALLGVPPDTLYSWTRRRSKLGQSMPFRHLGKFIRFEKTELLQWFMSLDRSTTVGRPFGVSRPVPKPKSGKAVAA